MPPDLRALPSAVIAALSIFCHAPVLADAGGANAPDRQAGYVADRENLRIARLRDARPGTVDFCSVVRVTDVPAPLDRDAREVTCHRNFGSTSLAELEAAGWEVTDMTSSVHHNRWGYHTTTLSITVRKSQQAGTS